MVETSVDLTVKSTNVVKFLCSYGGKILPRHPDGQLRYVGGETRVVSVDRSISFTDLLVKLGELCGSPVSLRCQLPKEDLDALISITSDEDLANVIEEYDRASQPSKIKAFLSFPKSGKKISPPSSVISSNTCAATPRCRISPLHRMAAVNRCVRQISSPPPVGYPIGFNKSAGGAAAQMRYYPNVARGNPTHCYLVHNGNHWQ